MEPFHHPTTWFLAGIQAAGMNRFLSSWSHMSYVLALGNHLLGLVANIARVSAQMLRRLFTGLWTGNDDGI
jgi:hypothetical protein